MIALLQWPSCSRSPSRNHTPGTICLTVFGCASPRVRNRLMAARALKTVARRKGFIGHLEYQLATLARRGLAAALPKTARPARLPAIPAPLILAVKEAQLRTSMIGKIESTTYSSVIRNPDPAAIRTGSEALFGLAIAIANRTK